MKSQKRQNRDWKVDVTNKQVIENVLESKIDRVISNENVDVSPGESAILGGGPAVLYEYLNKLNLKSWGAGEK